MCWWILIQIPWLWTAPKKLLDHCGSQKTSPQTSWLNGEEQPEFSTQLEKNHPTQTFDEFGIVRGVVRLSTKLFDILKQKVSGSIWTKITWLHNVTGRKNPPSVVFPQGFLCWIPNGSTQNGQPESRAMCVKAGLLVTGWSYKEQLGRGFQALLFRLSFGEKFWSKKTSQRFRPSEDDLNFARCLFQKATGYVLLKKDWCFRVSDIPGVLGWLF